MLVVVSGVVDGRAKATAMVFVCDGNLWVISVEAV